MATATPAQQSAIVNLYVALFNRAPDATGFEFWTQALANGAPLSVVTGAFFVSPETTTIYPAVQTAQQFVSAFYQTVFGRAPDAEGLVFWTNALNAAGGPTSQSAKALLVSKIVDIVSAPLSEKPAGLTDAQYAETVHDRELFGKKNVAALDFAVNVKSNDLNAAKQVLTDVVTPTTPTTPTDPTPVNETVTLTASADEKTTGAGNDTFNGFRVIDQQNERYVESLNSGDILDGGAGTGDKLNAELFMCGTVTPTLRNIEIVSVMVSVNGTLDLANATGVKQVGFADSDNEGRILHVGDAALFVSNQSGRVTFQGSLADNLSLTLTDAGTAERALGIYLNSSGDVAAKATAYNIVASNTVTEFYNAQEGAHVLDVTVKATGTNVITLSEPDAATVQAITVTGTGSVDFSGAAFSALTAFTGGVGDDSVTFALAPEAGAVINGGGGRDTIGMTLAGYFAVAGYESSDIAKISNFEVLKITDVVTDGTLIHLFNLPGLNSIVLAGGIADGDRITVAGLGTSASVELRGESVTTPIQLEQAVNGQNDALTLVLNNTYEENNDEYAQVNTNRVNVTMADIETLNVVSTGVARNAFWGEGVADSVNNNLRLESTGLVTLNVTGDKAFTFRTTDMHDSLKTIDASALTAAAYIDAYGSSEPVALTIKGSLTASNALIGSSTDDTIIGGANADVITGGYGADTLTGGKGNDTFAYNSGAESRDVVVDTITDFQANTYGNGVGGTAFNAAGDVELRNGDVLQFAASRPNDGIDVAVRSSLLEAQSFITSKGENGVRSAALDATNHMLYLDLNADGAIDSAIKLTGVTTLTSAAFELVALQG